ncbi:CesT family type III secretion system chaperone [Caenimonas sp. SL110]|uniref:CesT family type III secretion system chaperone n=1 Tax=Caenimonas sp. SL110 TaxID=1450524 RepID=UPI00065474B8|nr:CesT family type III secretion system chaperone [Caenimonas sp. SL110]
MTTTTANTYNELIHAFAAHVGLDGSLLAKTQELVIDDLLVGLACEGTQEMGDLLYFVNLGAPSPESAPAVYRTLLHANNMWAGTGGATLGVQADTGDVILAGRIDLNEVTAQGLAAMLDGFADTGQFWKRFVAGEVDLGEETTMPVGMRV